MKLSPQGDSNTFNKNVYKPFAKLMTKQAFEDNGYDLFLWQVYQLFRNYDVLDSESYAFLVDRESYDMIGTRLNKNPHTIRQQIRRHLIQVTEQFTFNPIEVIETQQPTEELFDTLAHLQSTFKLREKQEINRQIEIYDVPHEFDRGFNATLDDTEFTSIADALKMFSIPYRQLILSRLDKRVLGYVDYLMTTPDKQLTKQDKERRDILYGTTMLEGSDV